LQQQQHTAAASTAAVSAGAVGTAELVLPPPTVIQEAEGHPIMVQSAPCSPRRPSLRIDRPLASTRSSTSSPDAGHIAYDRNRGRSTSSGTEVAPAYEPEVSPPPTAIVAMPPGQHGEDADEVSHEVSSVYDIHDGNNSGEALSMISSELQRIASGWQRTRSQLSELREFQDRIRRRSSLNDSVGEGIPAMPLTTGGFGTSMSSSRCTSPPMSNEVGLGTSGLI
jgi:hypothetical protein